MQDANVLMATFPRWHQHYKRHCPELKLQLSCELVPDSYECKKHQKGDTDQKQEGKANLMPALKYHLHEIGPNAMHCHVSFGRGHHLNV